MCVAPFHQSDTRAGSLPPHESGFPQGLAGIANRQSVDRVGGPIPLPRKSTFRRFPQQILLKFCEFSL
jgi:hypothetical protein